MYYGAKLNVIKMNPYFSKDSNGNKTTTVAGYYVTAIEVGKHKGEMYVDLQNFRVAVEAIEIPQEEITLFCPVYCEMELIETQKGAFRECICMTKAETPKGETVLELHTAKVL